MEQYEPTQPKLNSIMPAVKDAVHNTYKEKFESCLKVGTVLEPVSVHVMDGVDYIDGVITASECSALRSECDNCKDLKFWSLAGRNDESARSFRDADTVEVKSTLLAGIIWERMRRLLSCPIISISDDEDDVNWERELVGDWEATSLNYDLLFAKYPSGGAFAPHTDGRAIHNFNTRSFSSVIFFLNDIPEGDGGGTKFYKAEATKNLQLQQSNAGMAGANRWTADDSLVLGTVSAVSGRMLIFHQALVHEGVPPASPQSKYIIRSDIMYTRRPGICTQPKDIEAYSIFKEAEDLAESGQVDKAIPLFRRAFKMSPDLARVMGQG